MLKVSIEKGGSYVNQLNTTSFKNVGNARRNIMSSIVYKLIWIASTSTCLSEVVVLSYRSIIRTFQLDESMVSIDVLANGCRRVPPIVTEVFPNVCSWDLTL